MVILFLEPNFLNPFAYSFARIIKAFGFAGHHFNPAN